MAPDKPVRVLALIPLPPATRTALAARYALVETPGEADHEVQAVVTNGTTGLDAALLARLPALRLACAFGVGHENIDLAAARARGVWVTHAPDTNAETVADHAIGFLLALCRGYGPLTAAVFAGRWEASRAARPTLNGATLGLIGLGGVGQAIARRAQAFGMRVAYHSRHARADLPYAHHPALLSLAETADHLVAACPGGAATRHIVNAPVLRALGPGGFFVNVARGSVVDTGALVSALREGHIAGAGLDVLEGEPAVPPQLATLDNLLLTPHMAGRSPVAQQAQTDALLASLEAFFAGRRPAHVVAAP